MHAGLRRALLLVLAIAVGAFACTTDNDGMPTTARTTRTPAAGDRVPTGLWGGDDIILTVTPTGATVEYECAAGRIDEPLIVDQDGHFEAEGLFAAESGGPVQAGARQPKGQPASYTGSIDGSAMTLTVFLPKPATRVGIFDLERGRQPNLERCV